MSGNTFASNNIPSEVTGEDAAEPWSKSLSFLQAVLLVGIAVLAISIVSLTLLSSLQSSKNARTFQDSSFLTTNLANIQRGALLLTIETERYLNDPSVDLAELDLQRSLLANQLRIYLIQADGKSNAGNDLAVFMATLDQFDALIADMRLGDDLGQGNHADEMREVLPTLDLDLKVLYDREEQSFFSVFRRSLIIQHNSERLLLAASGVITVLGVVVSVSLGRTFRALRLETRERRVKEREAKILAEIGRVMSSSLRGNEIYGLFSEWVSHVVPYHRIALAINSPDRQSFTIAHVEGLLLGDGISDGDPPDAVPMNGTISEHVMETGASVLIQSERLQQAEEPFPAILLPRDLGFRSFLATPLVSNGEVIGSLHLWSMDEDRYTDRHVAMAEQVADQIAGAVANVQLYSERQRIQEQMIQSQKMEAIGELAGGVAHDFNNLLTPIMGYSQMELQNHHEEKLHSRLEEIFNAAERASGLVHQLLAFSRKQVIEPIVLNSNELVASLEKMLHRLIGEHIEFITSLAPDLGLIKADPTQVDQLVINLVVNARDAMPDGGSIKISTQNVDESDSPGLSETGQRWIRLSVADNGIGMSDEVKARIFEPFFTTKEVGEGTGLGLATCYGIVAQNGGHIEVESELGVGTTFHLYLPRVDDGVATRRADDDPDLMPAGSETILLVEDEERVRTYVSDLLQELGYKVLVASDGEDALATAGRYNAGPIHMLLTDVVMPRMGGKELADRILASHPDIRVIFASGYPDSAIASQGVLEEGTTFIQKPLTPVALAKKIREVFDTP